MNSSEPDKDWKLKLRYGKLTTPFQHRTVIAEGIVGKLSDGFSCRPGPAFMGMKTWASSDGEASHMVSVIGERFGFTVTGRIYVYDTAPVQPPGDTPSGYDIQFTPFDPNAA
jgi:hypothetical protein